MSHALPRKKISLQAGVAMLEVLVSIIMLAIGVLALIGLQASMNTAATDAKYRAEASYLANQLLGQMWVDQANLTRYAATSGACDDTGYVNCTSWMTTVANRLPAGTAVVTIVGTAVTVKVSWQAPGGSMQHNYQVVANVLG